MRIAGFTALALAVTLLSGCMATEAVMNEMTFGEYDASSRLDVTEVDGAILTESDALFICARTAPHTDPTRLKDVQFYLFLPLIDDNYTVDATDLVVDGRVIPLYRHDRNFGGSCTDDSEDTVRVPVVSIAGNNLSDGQLARRLKSEGRSPVVYLVAQPSEHTRLIYMHETPVVAGSTLIEFEALTTRKAGNPAWALALPGAVILDIVTLPIQIPLYIVFAMTFGDTEEDLGR